MDWGQIKEKVSSLLGQNNVNWLADVVYNAVEDNQDPSFGKDARGTLLFKYDPKQQDVDPHKLIKVWNDGRGVYEDAW